MSAPDPADTVIEQALLRMWDDGNAAGLDGWIGPERGEEPDDYAISERRKCVDRELDKLTELLADPAGRDEWLTKFREAQAEVGQVRQVCREVGEQWKRAEAEVARLTARLGDCHCDLNPATTDGPHEDCPQHGRRYAEWVEATDAKGAQVADLREWRRKILDVMGYDDTPEYAEELLTWLPVWKAEGEADRGHITELRATVERCESVLGAWGIGDAEEGDTFDSPFSEAIRKSGAWRFERDITKALDPGRRPVDG